MPPAIHPVDLVDVLRQKNLTPAIIFLTSRRACDEAIDSFAYRPVPIPKERTEAITKVFENLFSQYPSITDHPLLPLVQQYGVAAHHAGHLPSWKIAIEELMRGGCLDAVFATTTLAAGVDFPARTVVISQSSVRKAKDFTDLTVGEQADPTTVKNAYEIKQFFKTPSLINTKKFNRIAMLWQRV